MPGSAVTQMIRRMPGDLFGRLLGQSGGIDCLGKDGKCLSEKCRVVEEADPKDPRIVRMELACECARRKNGVETCVVPADYEIMRAGVRRTLTKMIQEGLPYR